MSVKTELYWIGSFCWYLLSNMKTLSIEKRYSLWYCTLLQTDCLSSLCTLKQLMNWHWYDFHHLVIVICINSVLRGRNTLVFIFQKYSRLLRTTFMYWNIIYILDFGLYVLRTCIWCFIFILKLTLCLNIKNIFYDENEVRFYC